MSIYFGICLAIQLKISLILQSDKVPYGAALEIFLRVMNSCRCGSQEWQMLMKQIISMEPNYRVQAVLI